jgi:hypothetical protein
MSLFFMDKITKKFLNGCQQAAEILKENTPVDTQRLKNSTRAQLVKNSKDEIIVRIIQGGISQPGVLREEGIERDVDYAGYVEMNQSYVRNSLKQMTSAITDEMC